MIIQHNIVALNSYNQLKKNGNTLKKNLEKLSSGYKINKAGDDAAGLAVSEKMRAQIAALTTAQENALNGSRGRINRSTYYVKSYDRDYRTICKRYI